jgi:hypothetical protein
MTSGNPVDLCVAQRGRLELCIVLVLDIFANCDVLTQQLFFLVVGPGGHVVVAKLVVALLGVDLQDDLVIFTVFIHSHLILIVCFIGDAVRREMVREFGFVDLLLVVREENLHNRGRHA